MRGHATIDNKYIKYGMLDNILIGVTCEVSGIPSVYTGMQFLTADL